MLDRESHQLRSGSSEEYILLGGCCAAILYFGVYPGPLLDFLLAILP
jgi:hypothetical protein